MKNEDKILKAIAEEGKKFKWKKCVFDMPSLNIPFIENVVAENVIEFDQKLKVMDLQASNGWLCPWKERSGISF